jgi:hypothetical protein
VEKSFFDLLAIVSFSSKVSVSWHNFFTLLFWSREKDCMLI